jgi:hypothetical protein
MESKIAWATRVRAGAVMCLTGALACAHRPLPVVYDAREFDPPDLYRSWWREVEECSTAEGDFDAMRWFEAPGVVFLVRGQMYAGYWFDPDRIVIAEERLEDPLIVRHEMLHAILQQEGHGPEFTFLCASLVSQLPHPYRRPIRIRPRRDQDADRFPDETEGAP